MNGKARSSRAVQSAVAYIRVSSDEQAREDRYSLPQQRKAIEAYCRQRGGASSPGTPMRGSAPSPTTSRSAPSSIR
jgi:hypothetical protein